QQIRKSTRAASPDTPSELMKLRQTKFLRPANDNGIRPGNIETALNDIGREEHVRITFDEGHHSIVDIFGRQSAMKAHDTKIRSGRLYPCQHRFQILDTGANQEALSVAPLLTQQSCGDRGVR